MKGGGVEGGWRRWQEEEREAQGYYQILEEKGRNVISFP